MDGLSAAIGLHNFADTAPAFSNNVVSFILYAARLLFMMAILKRFLAREDLSKHGLNTSLKTSASCGPAGSCRAITKLDLDSEYVGCTRNTFDRESHETGPSGILAFFAWQLIGTISSMVFASEKNEDIVLVRRVLIPPLSRRRATPGNNVFALAKRRSSSPRSDARAQVRHDSALIEASEGFKQTVKHAATCL
jgi:hypothetical protein